MRLRNIKGSKEVIAASPYVVQNPEDYKGKWSELFHNNHPLHIEIGMGKGQFIHTLASENPDINYIGIEMYSSVLYEVDRIYLNFSDPWPKDRHAKRRLTSEGFLNLYHTILNPDGYIQFKTDNRDLFDFSVETAENSPIWNIKELTYDLHHSEFLQGNIMTEYESKFVAEGKPICRFVLSR